MRTLKFRFYDKTEKKMKYFDSIWNMPDPGYDFDEIQQFSGLLDKAGKEIYEGDLLYRDGVYTAVVWRQRDATFTASQPSVHCPAHEFEVWEVIGNIYSNPEFLP